MGFTKKARDMAKTLGIKPEDLFENFGEAAYFAALEVGKVLDNVLYDLQRSSESGALDGYHSVVAPISSQTKIHFRKAGFSISGKGLEWIVWVEASSHHQSIDLNVFDILDVGRPKLPYKGDSVYPMWGVTPEGPTRVTPGGRVGGRFSLARQIEKITAVRREPRSSGNDRSVDGSPLRLFTHGPVSKQNPANLYQRAFKRAKSRLGNLGYRGLWDVIYVPNREKWVK